MTLPISPGVIRDLIMSAARWYSGIACPLK